MEPQPDPTPPTRPERGGLKRRLLRVVRLIIAVYVGLCAVLYALQTRLIFPGSATQGTPEARVTPRAGAELVRLPTRDGPKVAALFGGALNADGTPRPDAFSRPTVLFLYGNAMCVAAAEPLFQSFRRLGVNVLMPDYLGYGLSEGVAGEAGCYAAADAAYDHLRSRPDVDPDKLVAVGWSLGGGVAVDLAARRPLAGLAVLSSFTSLVDLARSIYPFVPTSLLLAHRMDSLSKIGRITCPILIGHGTADPIVPASMSDRLASAAPAAASARVFKLPGVGHNDFFDAGWPTVRAELLPFFERVARSRPGGP